MDVEVGLGADIGMVFDECVETAASWERTRESMGLTHAWARRSKDHFESHKHLVPWSQAVANTFDGKTAFEGETQSLFGIVQGGMYADLRKESAERLVEMDLPGYAIGGLAGGGPREGTRGVIARTLGFLPQDRARCVRGGGYPGGIE